MAPGPLIRGRRALATGLAIALVLALGCAGSSKRGVTHTMRSGETIYRLSRYYQVPARDIVRANRIDDVAAIPVGRKLFIPGARRAPPSRSLVSKAGHTPSAPRADLRSRARREADLRFAWPVRGKLSSRYGWRRGRRHEGIDIAARKGTRVRAAEAGRVIHSGRLGDYGKVVIIKHSGQYSTVYAHNNRNKVKKGQFVEKGDIIAEVGSTGNASGPHLHFEIRRARSAGDPLRYLP